MNQAQQIKILADKLSDGNPPCAGDALDALAEFTESGGAAEFLGDSNEGQHVISFSPNRAYLLPDGSVYEVTYSGADWHASLEEAAAQHGYLRKFAAHSNPSNPGPAMKHHSNLNRIFRALRAYYGRRKTRSQLKKLAVCTARRCPWFHRFGVGGVDTAPWLG